MNDTPSFRAGIWLKRLGLALAVFWIAGVVLLYFFFEEVAAGRSDREMRTLVRSISGAVLGVAALCFAVGYFQEKRRELTELLKSRRQQMHELKKLGRRLAEKEEESKNDVQS